MLARMWSNRNFHTPLVGVQNTTAPSGDSLVISHKTKLLLPYDPVFMFLSIYPKELKIYVHTKTMDIYSSFLLAKTWKQTKCLSVGEWINCGTSRPWNIIQE